MYTSIFALLVAVLVFGQQILKYRKQKKFINEFAASRHAGLMSTSRPVSSTVKSAVPIVLSVGCAIYLLFHMETVHDALYYLTIFVILAVIFTASIITGSITQRVYYVDNEFILGDSGIRFGDIKEINIPKFKASRLILRKGKTVAVTRLQAMALKSLCQERNLRVKFT